MRTVLSRTCVTFAAVFSLSVAIGCGGGRIAPRAPSGQPSPVASVSSQELFEGGRFDDVLARVSAMGDSASPRDAWFGALSATALGRPGDARALFDRAAAGGEDWSAATRLATALIGGDAAEIDAARAAAAAHPAHPIVQYQLGLAHLTRGAPAEAATALDRSAAADPSLAYAYYYAGLAYQKMNRTDLMANRFDTFLRLAPNAPQRPEVQSVMSTIRGQ